MKILNVNITRLYLLYLGVCVCVCVRAQHGQPCVEGCWVEGGGGGGRLPSGGFQLTQQVSVVSNVEGSNFMEVSAEQLMPP